MFRSSYAMLCFLLLSSKRFHVAGPRERILYMRPAASREACQNLRQDVIHVNRCCVTPTSEVAPTSVPCPPQALQGWRSAGRARWPWPSRAAATKSRVDAEQARIHGSAACPQEEEQGTHRLGVGLVGPPGVAVHHVKPRRPARHPNHGAREKLNRLAPRRPMMGGSPDRAWWGPQHSQHD